ncbi:cobalt-precorrin 5A hydrolase [Clostridium sp. Cult1]|uniref:cobalt-precorrin 5A hydrolase n=1 Tax=Clostridium sp. Cult1 TaxID=2079002 RepID=UPI001F325EDE|nr:cobalt-precorrin 5A hydrolase [Clostridium sp. Cult1]MCF6462896.1 cobalt-precorrin 5A hydrolase [Clostridium sp. Cult1]
MKIACISFTQQGKEIGEKLVKASFKNNKYTANHFINDEIHGGIKSRMDFLVKEYDGLIFISATGIAVRLMNPYIINKTIDPAVVVVDDGGNFSISLLSGHIGGANRLAQWVGDIIGAIPVITTASDNRGVESIDLFAMKNNYNMEDMGAVKDITAMMVNKNKVGFYSELKEVIKYDNLKILDNYKDKDHSIQGVIIVSSQKRIDIPYEKHCRLIPKNINIGIGCKRGMEGKRIIEAIENILTQLNLSSKGIKAIGTIEVKKGEIGIIEACNHFNCPLKIFTLEEIKKIEDNFPKSQFVKKTIGVYSVSEPSAYLLGGKMLTGKIKIDGITISVAKEV